VIGKIEEAVLDGNDLVAEDFPEVCQPIRRLDGIANRCSGQLYQGERTRIGWTAKDVVLPTLNRVGWGDDEQLRHFVRPNGYSLASGAIIKVAGITGRIRRMKFKRGDGQTVRPSLVVIDDPQTDESARSLSQCATRESILAGAVLGLAGPGKKISGIMPCTVIRPGDMADNILDRDKHPEWNGQRTKMVYSFPANEKLWQKYAELRAESLRMGHGGREATEFYRANREAMDEGAVVAWPERWNHDELSAVQHAMNLKLQDEAAFFAEYQNEPLAEEVPDEDLLSADQVAGKINRLRRGVVPVGCNHLTMFIDVQANLSFYVVAAWEDDFTGYVVDYGTWPDQKRSYFTLRDARQTLAVAVPGTGLEGSIYAGLERLTGEHLALEWRRDDGALLRIDRCLVDANWGSPTDVVYQSCRVQGKRAVRHVVFDTNFWKSFVHGRFSLSGIYGPSIHGDQHMAQAYQARRVAHGASIDYTPSSNVAAGQVVVLNSLIGVPARPIAATEAGAHELEGVFDVVKVNGQINDGAALYWDADGNPQGGSAGTGALTTTADSNPFFGFANGAAEANDETVRVRKVLVTSVANTIHNELSNVIADPGNGGRSL
jgi:predicted RecA/RadA family phage recombinase